jgi:hypothetical protein
MQSACPILSSVAFSALQYLSTMFHKRRVKKKLLNIKCVFEFLYNFSLKTLLILRNTERDMIRIGLHVKYPLFLADFNETRIFSRFSKNTKIYLVSAPYRPSITSFYTSFSACSTPMNFLHRTGSRKVCPNDIAYHIFYL